MEFNTLSIIIGISVTCLILWSLLRNMLLRAELNGAYKACNSPNEQNPSPYSQDVTSRSDFSNLILFAFVSGIVIFFGFIFASVNW